MPLRLGIDMDGVLADFSTALLAACREVTGADAAPGSIDDVEASDLKRAWRAILKTPNFWSTLAPYEPTEIERLYRRTRAKKWELFFLTKRPPTKGDTVQFQTQWWLESHGFYLPSVIPVTGSRGEVANALRLDVAVDDQLMECADIVGSSTTKAILMLRDRSDRQTAEQASASGVGVVSTLAEAIDVLERLDAINADRRGGLARLTDWFSLAQEPPPALPLNPRERHPLPPPDADA